jgi:hypothetical protein
MTTNAITLEAVCTTPSKSDDRYRCPICSRPKEFHAGYYVNVDTCDPAAYGKGRAVLLPVSITSINLDCLSDYETVGTDCSKKIPATHKVSFAAVVKEIERRDARGC